MTVIITSSTLPTPVTTGTSGTAGNAGTPMAINVPRPLITMVPTPAAR